MADEDGRFFRDRSEGGMRLAELLRGYMGGELVVLAIPRGGVPVGYEVARALGADLNIIVPRKIPLPWNPDVGFGAITEDGTVVLNESMVKQLNLSVAQIRNLSLGVFKEVKRQTGIYRAKACLPKVTGKTVILVDDGLASGYTMVAAARFLKKAGPKRLVAAAPVASMASHRAVAPEVDSIVSLHVPIKTTRFALGDHYRDYTGLSDADILALVESL